MAFNDFRARSIWVGSEGTDPRLALKDTATTGAEGLANVSLDSKGKSDWNFLTRPTFNCC